MLHEVAAVGVRGRWFILQLTESARVKNSFLYAGTTNLIITTFILKIVNIVSHLHSNLGEGKLFSQLVYHFKNEIIQR